MFITDIVTELSGAFAGPFSTTTEYIVGGYYTPGDGGGGVFVWIAPGPPLPPQDFGVIIHNANDTNGYFKRIYSGPINVRWFGAIMKLPDGTVQNTDVTTYFNAARNSPFTKDGTIYFPEDKRYDTSLSAYVIQPYVGAFNLLSYNINVLGDGVGSVLKANGSGNPVLILGNNPGAFWLFSKVISIKIDGESGGTRYDGAVYSDPSFPEFAGRWIFQNVIFENCARGIYKPKGNIGNTYENCTWSNNDFGYYAEDYYNPGPPVGVMHSGCDRFLGGHIAGSVNAGIYLKGAVDFGQVVVDGTIIENNPGFGIFIKLSSVARLTGNGIDLRNVWTEANAAPWVSGVLEGSQEVPPSGSTAVGGVGGSFNPRTNMLSINIWFNGLGSNTTGASINIGAPGNTGPAITYGNLTSGTDPFPTGVINSSGWSRSLLLDVGAGEVADLLNGDLYVNILTSSFPGGEIRAQLTTTVTVIDGTTYAPLDLRNYQFEGVRSVAITNASVNIITLIESSVNLYNCRSDDAGEPNLVEVSSSSSLVSYEHRNNYRVSENIFVFSLSYDGTGDIGQNPGIPTSVWGPLRLATQTGTYRIQFSQRFNELMNYEFIDAVGGFVFTTPIVGGVLSNISAHLEIGPGEEYHLNAGFGIYSNEIVYYVWSIHTYQCEIGDEDNPFGDPTGAIRTDPTTGPNIVLGQVIFKPKQWACSYGIKKWVGDPDDPAPVGWPITLYFNGNSGGGKFKIADYQVVKFDNLYDAQSYVNSRVFAEGEATCGDEEG